MLMRIRPSILSVRCGPRSVFIARPTHRALVTVAIETSCDDTAAAVLEQTSSLHEPTSAVLHFHKKITSNNAAYHGVHPLVSLLSHQENLATLVAEAIQALPASKRRPDFISVTRGPGMRSNLFVGLDTAKGLAVALQVPLVGVNHMHAHALAPRLVSALQNSRLQKHFPHQPLCDSSAETSEANPEFPFLSVLASGGHTLLIHSASLTEHDTLASTTDVAIGECLDKVARAVLPRDVLQKAQSTMYGPLLENFAFPSPQDGKVEGIAVREPPSEIPDSQIPYSLEDSTAGQYCTDSTAQERYAYAVPRNNEEALKQHTTKWGWGFNSPLSKGAGGLKRKSMEMSFSGLMTAVERAARFRMDPSTGKLSMTEREPEDISTEERRTMAREAMRAAFEHLASRVVLGLQHVAKDTPNSTSMKTIVLSGGVAANQFLRYILARVLVAHGYSDVRIVFPPASLCTDNAAMIAWCGLEMYKAGHSDPLTIRALRKWPLDELLSPPEAD